MARQATSRRDEQAEDNEGRPRVVHLTTVHHPLDPRIFWKQAVTLQEAGYDVHLVAPHDRSEERCGVPIHPLPQQNHRRGSGHRWRRLALQRHAFETARRLHADIYHFHDPELIPVGYALKRATGGRLIYDMHENYRWHGSIAGRLLRTLERWCFTWADHVIVANASQLAIGKKTGVPTTWIANYVKPLHRPDHRISAHTLAVDQPLQLLYAGVISKKRGLTYLLDLASTLVQSQHDWELHLAGICYVEADRKQAEDYLQRTGLHSALHLHGWNTYVPWSELMAFYQQAHVGLVLWPSHPNHTHKIPTKFYEYLHYGLPIICSDFPLWRRFIEQHECGAVVPPGDTQAVLQVLNQWIQDPATYHQRSAAALRAAPQFQWNRMGQRLTSLYDELLRT